MNLLIATEALHGWLTSKVTWSRFSFSSVHKDGPWGPIRIRRSTRIVLQTLVLKDALLKSRKNILQNPFKNGSLQGYKAFQNYQYGTKDFWNNPFTSNQPKITQGSQALREFAVAFEKFPRNFSLLSSLPPHEKRRDRERGREGTNKNKNNPHDEPKYV